MDSKDDDADENGKREKRQKRASDEGQQSQKQLAEEQSQKPLAEEQSQKPLAEEQSQKQPPESERQQSAAESKSSIPQLGGHDSGIASEEAEQKPQNQVPDGHRESRGILREEGHSSDSGKFRRKASSNTPRIHITGLNEIPAESVDTLAGSSAHSKSSKVSSGRSDSLEGESLSTEQESTGPSLGQYQYQKTREDYEALSKSLVEKTVHTLIRLGEIHKAAWVDNQAAPTMKAQIPPRMSKETAEAAMYLLDKELKSTARRINESKREQAHTLQRINDLEVKMFKKQESEYIRDIMTKVPTDDDLRDIEMIRQLMLERRRLQREIEKLKTEMASMNKAMANADVIISDCAAIKKPRRVIICAKQALPEEMSSREIIGKGESPAKQTSPPTTATDMNGPASPPGGHTEEQDSGQTTAETEPKSAPEPDQPDGKIEQDQSNGKIEKDQSNTKIEKDQSNPAVEKEQSKTRFETEQSNGPGTSDSPKDDTENGKDKGKDQS